MLEGQWSAALASNNIRAIIRWLRKLAAEGEVDMEEVLLTFSCWVQRTSEFAKKELLTLCFSRCQGLWMFLDRSSFTRVHMLLQRLRNLLTLAQWARRQLRSAHLWHGVGVPCLVCRDTFGSSDVRPDCWNREQRALKQHIWLGRLVQWWGIMGLLPKYPDAQELKRISQMWKEMGHNHCKASLETPGWKERKGGRLSSLIQEMVTQLEKQHGCIWTPEDYTGQCYPPPNLQALLKLVLVPHIDNMSVQALLMYFVLDMANFLQCKDDLLLSFCHAFSLPPSFSQQIRAFWMLDHGHTKASMELLLSPRAAAPWLSWQHRCILHCLLTRKQPQLALRFLHWTRPTIESAEDAKLCADVLLQNSCVPEAWALLKRGHAQSTDMVLHFLQACHGVGLTAEALKYIPAGYNGEGDSVDGIVTTGSQTPLKKTEGTPCPLSAELYQAQKVKTVSPEELVQLIRKAVSEVRKPPPKLSEVVWPNPTKAILSSRDMLTLSTQALRHLTPSPSPLDRLEEPEQTEHTDGQKEEQSVHNGTLSLSQQRPESPEHISSPEDQSSVSVSSLTSSSCPLLGRGHHYVYECTVTLQRISSLLTDGDDQSRDEEDEEEDSRYSSSPDALQDFPELQAAPLDGATDPVFLPVLNKEGPVELVLTAEEPAMDGSHPVYKSSEDIQSAPGLCEPQVERHDEKMGCRRGASEEITAHDLPDDLWSSAVSLNQEDQSDCIPYEILSLSDADVFDCWVEEELHQKTLEPRQQEEAAGCFVQGSSSAVPETTSHLLSEDPVASLSGASAGTGQWHTVSNTVCTTELQRATGSSLTLIKSNSAASDTNNQSSPKAQSKTDECGVQSASAWLHHCKSGSWWKQDLENCGAASGFLCASEPGAAITPDNKRASLVLSQPYSLANFTDFTAKQKGDNRDGKQADKEEPAGWSCLGRGPQGAIRTVRSRSSKGKRAKRA